MDDEVFSKLPKERPSVRSPRRDAAKSPPRAAKPRTPPADPGPPEPLREEGSTGIDDLAKAGVTAAFEAVGVGLRIGRWAVRGLRDTVERR